MSCLSDFDLYIKIPSPSILPILNGQYQAARNANNKFWEGTSVESYKIQLPVFLFLVLHQFLYQEISFSQHSRISFNIIWKKFYPKFSFFNGFTLSSQLHALNDQNLLKVIKVFCRFSLKCLLKYFFPKIYWQNPAKHFLKLLTTDSLVFFSKYSSTAAILTQESVITCK